MSRFAHKLLFSVFVATTVTGAIRVAFAFPPENLADALPRITDRANRRTPLLLIGTEKVRRNWNDDRNPESLHKLYEQEDAKPPLASVLIAFKRQVVSCGTVQVVAPLVRVGINPYPGKPEDWAQIGRARAARLLFTSLSPAQWVAASSPSGIGLSDMQSAEQKAWFLSSLPQPLRLRQMTKHTTENHEYFSHVDGVEPVTIAPEQIRVRVVRSMYWSYRQDKNGGYHGGSSTSSSSGIASGGKFWSQVSEPASDETPNVETYNDRLRKVVVVKESNRLQKGAVSFNTPPIYGKTVNLDGAKTVGELVKRIAEASGLELYTHRAVSGLSVTVLGASTTADAADLLKALCHATTGTVRAVTDGTNTVYLLTANAAGVIPDRLRLAEWAADVDALVGTEQTAFNNKTRDANTVRDVGFGEGVVQSLPDDAMRAAEAQMTDPKLRNEDYGQVRIPVSVLTPTAQAKVREDIARNTENYGANAPTFDTKNVYAQFDLKTQFVVAGYGTFSGSSLSDLRSLLPQSQTPPQAPPTPTAASVTIPPTLSMFVALRIAVPRTDGAAKTVATWAKRRGFTALFVTVPTWNDDAPESLSRVIAAAKPYGLAVYPSVSVLRVTGDPSGVAANLLRARNLHGETLPEYRKRRKDAPANKPGTYAAQELATLGNAPDWLDASDKVVQNAVAERVAKIAAVPGIAGIALTDVAAPGTGSSSNMWIPGELLGQSVGYTNTARVAFVRQENLDPVDLPPQNGMQPWTDWSEHGENGGYFAVFYADGWSMNEQVKQAPAYRRDAATGAWKVEPSQSSDNVYGLWSSLLSERNREHIGAIRTAAKLPGGLPVIADVNAEGYSSPSPMLWDITKSPLLPEKADKTALYSFTLQEGSTPETVRRGLTSTLTWLQKNGANYYGGLVFDILAKPLDESLKLLSPLLPVVSP